MATNPDEIAIEEANQPDATQVLGDTAAPPRASEPGGKVTPVANEVPAPLQSTAVDHPDDTWYFAYGSNLLIEQKDGRTGAIRRAIPCRLPGYRLTFNKRHHDGFPRANIVPDPAAEVWGVAYLCNPEAMRTMDRYEGVSGGHYERTTVAVTTRSGGTLTAITYIAGPDYVIDEARPSAEYLNKILTGARYHGLPEDYVRRIELLGEIAS